MDFSLHAPESTAGLINTDTTPEYYFSDVYIMISKCRIKGV